MNKKRLSRKAKIIISSISAFVIVIGILANKAADRYLIEHVEIDLNKSNKSTSSVSSTISEVFSATDMTYKSDSKSINIKKFTNNSGNKTLTYYVADIQLSDSTQLKSAFAKNKFGRNIIQNVSTIASNNDAIFAINGDYYGFRSNGIIIRNGAVYRDEPARTGLAFYKDGSMKVYNEKSTTGEKLVSEGVWNTLSFGPALLEDGNIVSGISDFEVDTNFGNHSIQGNQPRTGVGIIDNNHFIFIVADGRNNGYSSGVTMTEFAEIFKDYGCKTAYNIDGGGSSEMWFRGNVVNVPANKGGSERGTSDILFIS